MLYHIDRLGFRQSVFFIDKIVESGGLNNAGKQFTYMFSYQISARISGTCSCNCPGKMIDIINPTCDLLINYNRCIKITQLATYQKIQ